VRILAVTVVLVALAFAAPGRAAGDEGAELKARTHFAAGEYKEALEIYARLYAETMHPTYLRNIARCHQNLGNADKAISSFREYLRKAHDLTPEQRREIEGYIAEMEQLKQSRAGAAAGPSLNAASPPRTASPPIEAPAPALAAAPPAAPPPVDSAPALVGPPTVTAPGSANDDGDGPFYTRVWFWGVVAGVAAAGIVTAVLVSRDGGLSWGNRGLLDLR
jgi:tetratricopeptide (TPR) repeat protein